MEFFVKPVPGKTVSLDVDASQDPPSVRMKVSGASEQKERARFIARIPTGETMKLELDDVDLMGKFRVDVEVKEENYIEKESALHLILRKNGDFVPVETKKMHIFVRGIIERDLRLEVKSGDTIGNLKARIDELFLIAPEKQRICEFYSGKELLDNFTLSDQFIKTHNVLRVHVQIETMCIFIKLTTSEITNFKIEMHDAETIESLMKKIEDETKIPPRLQRLLYKGKQLADWQTVASARIENEATLNLVLRMLGCAKCPGH